MQTSSLKLRKVDGYWNYDKSEFEKPSALLNGDDAELEALWGKQYSLKEFTAQLTSSLMMS